MAKPKDPIDQIVDLCRWFERGATSGRQPDTEFLGDFYQHYCEDARKGRALVQTPDFVRSFMLERTFDVALDERGPAGTKMIDPSCGCGHILVDAFRMAFEHWSCWSEEEIRDAAAEAGEPDPGPIDRIKATQLALDHVFGVDLDPACVAIARARLLFEAWAASGVRADFRINVHQGDSLLHHRPLPTDDAEFGPWGYDVAAVRRVLAPGQYAAVVANPPYVRCKDAKLNETYRARYPSCYMQYSLGLPFTELCFGLAIPGERGLSVVNPEATRKIQASLFAMGDEMEDAA